VGFDYSTALKSKTGPWTYDELNEWLTKPSAYAPGTKMGFAGISNDKTRANVIDYIHTLSHNPEPLPTPPAPAATPVSAGTPAAKAPAAGTAPTASPAAAPAAGTTPAPAKTPDVPATGAAPQPANPAPK
jgi:cytochrome c